MDLRCGPLPPGAIDFFAPMDFFCAPGGPGGPDRPDGAIDLRADMDFRGPSEEGGGVEVEPPASFEGPASGVWAAPAVPCGVAQPQVVLGYICPQARHHPSGGGQLMGIVAPPHIDGDRGKQGPNGGGGGVGDNPPGAAQGGRAPRAYPYPNAPYGFK